MIESRSKTGQRKCHWIIINFIGFRPNAKHFEYFVNEPPDWGQSYNQHPLAIAISKYRLVGCLSFCFIWQGIKQDFHILSGTCRSSHKLLHHFRFELRLVCVIQGHFGTSSGQFISNWRPLSANVSFINVMSWLSFISTLVHLSHRPAWSNKSSLSP